jgi:RNA polymerase sigma-54 factor
MKQTIQLRLGQSLTMTPQLQQAIRLLQLSTLDLQAEIQENLERNPLLEQEEAQSDYDDALQDAPEPAAEDLATSAEDAEDVGESENLTSELNDQTLPEDLPVDSAWDDIYEPSPAPLTGSPEDSGRDPYETQSGTGESLAEHLIWQLRLAPLSDTDRAIGLTIIDAIDEDGYLSSHPEEIHANLAEDEIELDEIWAMLHLIQHFDPLGVGALDLRDCLQIQLRELPPGTPHRDAALALVRDHLDLLAAHDFVQLKRKLRISDDDLLATVQLIRSLDPRPGSRVSASRPEYIVPDVFVGKHNGAWRVELNPDVAPRLRINPQYAGLVKRADNSDDNNYLRTQLQEARWFIKSLRSRNETLLKVATSIVERQRAFLEYGEEAMKPMVLRDIAENLEMHESTISRVTTQKFMHTPRGIFEFKYFFSSHVGTADGGECSATAIRAMIRKLIADEKPGKPLSDSKIAALLVERGINVARRTVAKYREAMAIPPSNERKRLA